MIVLLLLYYITKDCSLFALASSNNRPIQNLKLARHMLAFLANIHETVKEVRQTFSHDLLNQFENNNLTFRNVTGNRSEFFRQGSEVFGQYEASTSYADQLIFDEPSSSLTLPVKTRKTTTMTTTPPFVWLTDPPTLAVTSLADGDILAGSIKFTTTPAPSDVALYNDFNTTSYLSVAFTKILEFVVLKEPQDVKSVMQHTEIVIVRLHEGLGGRLLWLKQPMTKVLEIVAAATSTLSADELKSYALALLRTMKNRQDLLSPEVNSVIDYADSLVTAKDGEQLFTVVREFRDFPNGTKTGYQLCQAIIEAFETPFRVLVNDPDLEDFVGAANKVFLERFPQLRNYRRFYLRGRGLNYKIPRKLLQIPEMKTPSYQYRDYPR